MNFDKAINRLLGHEGGFTNNSSDPGNWTGGKIGKGQLKGTKFGISAASYPNEDIVGLTRERAVHIYWRDFWTPLRGEQLHDGVAYQLLDYAVNSGIPRAIKDYQRALGVTPDGDFGPKSQAAALTTSETDQLMRVLAYRLKFMKDLPAWRSFSRGWADRIAENLLYAAEDS